MNEKQYRSYLECIEPIRQAYSHALYAFEQEAADGINRNLNGLCEAGNAYRYGWGPTAFIERLWHRWLDAQIDRLRAAYQIDSSRIQNEVMRE